MTTPAVWISLAADGALLLPVTPWGLKLIARRAVRYASQRHTGPFTDHTEHDAWICPHRQGSGQHHPNWPHG